MAAWTRAVAICQLKRFVADVDLASGDPYRPVVRAAHRPPRGDRRRRADRAFGRLLPGPARPRLHDLRRKPAARRPLAAGEPEQLPPRGARRRDWPHLAVGRGISAGHPNRPRHACRYSPSIRRRADRLPSLSGRGAGGEGCSPRSPSHDSAGHRDHQGNFCHLASRRVCRRHCGPRPQPGSPQRGRRQGRGRRDRPLPGRKIPPLSPCGRGAGGEGA